MQKTCVAWVKSLMVGMSSQGHEMYCHDLEVMSLNPSWVKLGLHRVNAVVLLSKLYLNKNMMLLLVCAVSDMAPTSRTTEAVDKEVSPNFTHVQSIAGDGLSLSCHHFFALCSYCEQNLGQMFSFSSSSSVERGLSCASLKDKDFSLVLVTQYVSYSSKMCWGGKKTPKYFVKPNPGS